MGRKRKCGEVFADLCESVQRRMFAFEYSIDEENGTAQIILDSVHRIKLSNLSLFPCVGVTYRQDDRRYVLQTEGSAGAIRHNAMLVEYARMAEFYNIVDISQLKYVIESVHRNASVCFHKIVKQGDLFIAVFTVPTASCQMKLNTGVLNDIEHVSSSWIELHPDTKELRLCVSLIPQALPHRERMRDEETLGSGDHDHPSHRHARGGSAEAQAGELTMMGTVELPPHQPAHSQAGSSQLTSASSSTDASRPTSKTYHHLG